MLLFGNGAFMKNKEDAIKLAKTMKKIGKLAGKDTICVLTSMDEPLGYAVGNQLEVIEATKCLKGDMPDDVKKVVLTLGAYMIKLAGKGEDIEENKTKILQQIKNKKAYNKFLELVERQGGDISYIENTNKFEKAEYVLEVICKNEGFVQEINAIKIGKLASFLGAGRITKEDKIDNKVGIVLNKKKSDSVKKGEVLAYIYANNLKKAKKAKDELENIIKIGEIQPKKEDIILEIL